MVMEVRKQKEPQLWQLDATSEKEPIALQTPQCPQRALHQTLGTNLCHVITSVCSFETAVRFCPTVLALALKTESTLSANYSGNQTTSAFQFYDPWNWHPKSVLLLVSFHAWIPFHTTEVIMLHVTGL